MRGAVYPIQNLSEDRRREIFTRLRQAAEERGVQLDVCACKNSDIASGNCNIAGTWPSRRTGAAQPSLVSWRRA